MKQLTIPVLVELANANASKLNGFPAVRDCVDRADVAIAIWQDRSRPEGIGLLVVKGNDIVRTATAHHEAFVGNVTAIRCIDADQAHALREVIGDWRPLQ